MFQPDAKTGTQFFVFSAVTKRFSRTSTRSKRGKAAGKLAFVLGMKQGAPIELSCWKLGHVDVLHMPGKLFAE
ncbi:MAG TPA: hypothetical protein VK137_12055 [Planctomycetaceae bacterium]|nr:hypothetical protein [Planctomycetaceae bacterium]